MSRVFLLLLENVSSNHLSHFRFCDTVFSRAQKTRVGVNKSGDYLWIAVDNPVNFNFKGAKNLDQKVDEG